MNTSSAAIESALMQGDLSKLTPEQRLNYYNQVCLTLGLNPLTKPFEYIQLNGKLTLYAKRDATDQLRKIHNVSVTIKSREVIGDVYVVTACASIGDRVDESTGAVAIAGLKGEALANAYLRCETKSKRRVTLSICGLGLLDETEMQPIPQEVIAQPQPPQRAPSAQPQAVLMPVEQPFADMPPSPPIEAYDPQEGLDANLGEYVINFGKYTGKRLCDLEQYKLDEYIKWLKKSADDKGKPLSGKSLEFTEVGERYLSESESRSPLAGSMFDTTAHQ